MRGPSKAEIALARLTAELAFYRTYFQGHMTREQADELLAGLKAMTDEDIVVLSELSVVAASREAAVVK